MGISDKTILFPNLHITLLNVGKNINIGGFTIAYYGIIIAIGMILAMFLILHEAKRVGIKQDDMMDVFLFAIIFGVAGARLYYVIFSWDLYKDNLISILYLREGGLAIYGGVIGGVLAILGVCIKKKLNFWKVIDLAAMGVLVGQICGRWGNFFNREAYGAETDVFCRMGLHYPGGTIYVHPTFLYESLWNLLGFVILHFVSKKHRRFKGQIFVSYLGWYGLGRYFIESLRTDSLYLGSTDIRVSQLLAAVCFGVSVIFLLATLRSIPQKLRLAVAQDPDADAAETDVTEEQDAVSPAAETAEEDPGSTEENADDSADEDKDNETDKEDGNEHQETGSQ